MEEEFRFVLLDFGHPMKNSTIKSVMNSLENILALGVSFPGHSKNTYFGISFLNSDFTILQSESDIRKNYDKLNKNIDNLLRTMQFSSKVTVTEYKHFLSNSIYMILRVAQEKFNLNNSCSQSKSLKINIAIVTKKTASILTDILIDVINKLVENFTTATSKQNYKIVQILSEPDEKTFGISEKCASIEWMTCFDNGSDLNYFFKGWFLNSPEKVQILLSKDMNLTLQCDVENLIFNPSSMYGKYDLYSDVYFKTSVRNSALGILKPVNNLEIINRIPVSNLCPTLVFGIPRRISATRNASSSWVKSQTNLKMFEELCRELHQTEQGLLAKSVAETAKGRLIIFHFLTSDGHMLLMNDVAPDELYLPKHSVMSEQSDPMDDGSAASFIRNCIQKIEFLDEYSPMNYSSGLYQYLKHHLMQDEFRKNFPEKFLKNANSFGKKCRKKKSIPAKNYTEVESCNGPKKKPKLDSEEELQNIHPALLPPEVVEKYRKVPSDAFNLLELGEDYKDSFS